MREPVGGSNIAVESNGIAFILIQQALRITEVYLGDGPVRSPNHTDIQPRNQQVQLPLILDIIPE